MPFTDPRLAAGEEQQDPANVYRPRETTHQWSSTGYDGAAGFARSIVQDGRVVGAETNKITRSSTEALATEANAAASTPYSRAVDGRTAQPLGPHEIKDDSILTFPAGQVTAAQARALGWLAPATSAQPQTTQGTPPVPFEARQEAPKPDINPDLVVEPLPDLAIDREFSALVDNTGGVEQLDAIRQVIEDGDISERTLGTLATQLQCEPEQLQQRIAPIMQAFEQQARTVMSEGGLDSNEVVAWAQQHRPDKLRLAMNRQATMRQTTGYADLRMDYLENLATHNPSMALAADLGSGITQRKDDKGRILVRLADGAEMEWKTAIRAFGIRKP